MPSRKGRLNRASLGVFALAIIGAVGVSGSADARYIVIERTPHVPGDVNGDGKSDITLVGGSGWNTIPVGYSDGVGGFNTWTNDNVATIPSITTEFGSYSLMGDWNGDGCSDVAVTGTAGAIVVGLSDCHGNFAYVNYSEPTFASVASQLGHSFAGDFNGDGYWDIATYSMETGTMAVALSTGTGFTTNIISAASLNFPNPFAAGFDIALAFGGWGNGSLAQFVSADFNHDGKYDFALLGASTTNIIVGISNGDGTFTMQQWGSELAGLATSGYVQVLGGDFNGDGYGDILLTGGEGWTTMPVAFGLPGGGFWVFEQTVPNFPALATQGRAVAGDFNGDGMTDVALTGIAGQYTIPVAFSTSNTLLGSFNVTETESWWMALVSAQPPGGAMYEVMPLSANSTDHWLLPPNIWSPCSGCVKNPPPP